MKHPAPPVAPARARAASWALGLALAGGLLAVSPLQAASYSLPKLFALALGTALAWAAVALQGAPRRPTPLDRPLLACAAALLAAFAASQDPFLSFVGRYRMYSMGVLPLSLCAAFFYAAARSGQAEEPLPLLRLLCAAGALMGLHAALQFCGVEPLAHMPDKFPQGRAVGTLGSPVYFGSVLVCLLPLTLPLLVDGRGWDRGLGAAGLLGVCAALFCTLSRGAWLGAAAGAALFFALSGRLRLPRARWLLAGAVVLALGGLAALQVRRGAGQSDSARLELWRSALLSVPDRPWLGSGPDTFEQLLRRRRTDGFIRVLGGSTQANAHNDLLQALTTTGLVGLAAYLWLVVAAGAAAWRARGPGAPARAAAAAALAGLFLQAKVNPVPLPSLVLAAFCAALLTPPPAAPATRSRRWTDLGVLVLCAAALAGIWRLSLADRSQKRAQAFAAAGRADAALAAFDRAERLNPAEVQYRVVHAQRLHAWAAAEADPARRLALLERAVRVGRAAARWRPEDVDSHQVLGVSLFALRQAGGPDVLAEAEASLDRALELDARFYPLLENRLKVARARGDQRKAAELSAELSRLEKLSLER